MNTIEKQFKASKGENGDVLLLFRVGLFYECYEEDAYAAAHILGITLRSCDGFWFKNVAFLNQKPSTPISRGFSALGDAWLSATCPKTRA